MKRVLARPEALVIVVRLALALTSRAGIVPIDLRLMLVVLQWLAMEQGLPELLLLILNVNPVVVLCNGSHWVDSRLALSAVHSGFDVC